MADPTLTQAQTNNNLLSTYFDAMNNFVSDPTGATLPPNCSTTLISLLAYSQLLGMSQARASDASSFQNGAAIENVNNVVAIQREFALRSKIKSNFYADASQDYQNDSNYWNAMSAFYNSILMGVITTGEPQ